MKYIKLTTVFHQGKDGDSVLHIQSDAILGIFAATVLDRKHRQEVNAVIYTKFGVFACAENPSVILAKLQESNLTAFPDE